MATVVNQINLTTANLWQLLRIQRQQCSKINSNAALLLAGVAKWLINKL